MKKSILLLVVFSLLALPAAAAASEFRLGGYIKMEVIWDSTQVNKWLYYGVGRNNDPNKQHGRLKFSSSNSRMFFAIKGPSLWGAKTSAYIEWDFDNKGDITPYGWVSEHKNRLGVRHCMFRLNWPETELMMGSYWSMLTEEVPEVANFGAITTAGFPFCREPQIRLTQVFALGAGKMKASIAVAEPTNGLWGFQINPTQTGNANPYTGESTETPKVEGRVRYDIDLWGKAAFWGKPRPFSVSVGAMWYRSRFRANKDGIPWAGQIFGKTNFVGVNAIQRDQEYMDHWMAIGSVFIPLIPTHTKSLAGTASLLAQWWVGQGMDGYIEDFATTSSYLRRMSGTGTAADPIVGDREMMRRFGGFVQLQYYFTNQWFAQVAWGLNRAFDVDRDRWVGDSTAQDPWKTNQHYYATLWYRPIQALKFGLEYTYVRSDYFQYKTVGDWRTDYGENHRVMFAGFYYF